MTDKELWKNFIIENNIEDCDYQAWEFGAGF